MFLCYPVSYLGHWCSYIWKSVLFTKIKNKYIPTHCTFNIIPCEDFSCDALTFFSLNYRANSSASKETDIFERLELISHGRRDIFLHSYVHTSSGDRSTACQILSFISTKDTSRRMMQPTSYVSLMPKLMYTALHQLLSLHSWHYSTKFSRNSVIRDLLMWTS